MFKPKQKKSFKTKEKVEFKLEFHATRVPQRGWDKLLVSLICLETNKVTAKTGKALVKNGACQWSEPVFESLEHVLEPTGGKGASKALYKLAVSMGLSRFGILGEATINLTDYMQAVVPISLPLQLQHCNSGSILHVKIQRIGMKPSAREMEDQREMLLEDDCQPAFLDTSQQCYGLGSPESIDKDDSTSTSRRSSDSVEAPQTPELSESRTYGREGRGGELVSPSSSIGSSSGGFHDYVRFNSSDGANQQLINDYTPVGEDANLVFSPLHSKRFSGDPTWTNGKLKDLEVAETTIKELKLEAASWEQQVKQMEHQMEELNKQFSNEVTRNGELERALAMLGDERDSIRMEMESLLYRAKLQEKGGGDGLNWQELQEELEYEKSMNSTLSLQLRKTQESNSELLLEIQDLEKMLQERDELAKPSNGLPRSLAIEEDLSKRVESLQKELEELERDSQELTEENMDLLSQLKQANDKLKASESTIAELEVKIQSSSYSYTEIETEKLREEMRVNLRDCEESYESKLATSRTLIDDANSAVMMVRSKNARLERELQTSEETISELLREMESLKSETDAHERDKSLLLAQHKGQLRGLREKASKVEQELMHTLKKVEESEAIIRDLKQEKSRDLTAIKKQLENFQEHVLATDSKYREALKELSLLKEEKLRIQGELATLLKKKDAAEANVAQLQSFNVVLQETLHSEQLTNSELVQKCQEKEAECLQHCEDLKANDSQLKALEETMRELESLGKEMQGKTGSLQKENVLCMSRIKELELQVASLEQEILILRTAKSACETEIQTLHVVNNELSENLKNAQEDIDWARENTNTLVNEIRELEGEIETDMVVQRQLKQSVSELEHQNQTLQSQIEGLLDKNLQMEKEAVLVSDRCKDALEQKDASLVSIQEHKRARDTLEASLQTIIKQQEDKINQLLESSGENRVQQALLDCTLLRDEKVELEGKVMCLQDCLNQAKKNALDAEKKVERALLEASMLADEKLELEENVLKLEEMLKQAEKYASSLKQNLDFQFQEATLKEQDTIKNLDKATAAAQRLQNEKLEIIQKLMALEAECAAGELDRKKVSAAMSKRESELEALQREQEDRERAVVVLKEERDKLKLSLDTSKQETTTLREKVDSYEKACSIWEQSKAVMEETILQLKASVAKDNSIELNNFKEQTDALRCQISEQDENRLELEKKILSLETEFKKKIVSLETELDNKATALASLEKELKDEVLLNSSRVKSLSALFLEHDTREESAEKIAILEGELQSKEAELVSSKQQMEDQCAQLVLKIEELESANKVSLKEQPNATINELLNELTNVQNQNTALSQRENELLSKIASQNAVLFELQSLKEEKRVLEIAPSNLDSSINGEFLSQRIVALEMELAEVMEANTMYKKELQSAFAKQHNVYTAALENLGSVEKVIQDLADLKRNNMTLEGELKDMRERYFNMSLQFAEVEAEREGLVMTIRNLRGTKKLTPHRSANF